MQARPHFQLLGLPAGLSLATSPAAPPAQPAQAVLFNCSVRFVKKQTAAS